MENPLQTIVFIDLADSTAAFQALGNEEVAGVISKLTQWIGRVCEAHDGRIVKFLGDGVLAEFDNGATAAAAAVFLQQQHTARIRPWPKPLRMGLKIGLASGLVVRMGDDAYGESINLASRLSDMSGSNSIWATESVIGQLQGERETVSANGREGVLDQVRYRTLGTINIRGITEPHSVFQIEWNDEVPTDLMTVRGNLSEFGQTQAAEPESKILLSWLDTEKAFPNSEMPIEIGRAPSGAFVVSDQRVSRKHASIEWINGAFVLTDLSSYGTWVRFSGKDGSETQLRRNQCVLHSSGEMALGAPFSDFSAPTLTFHVNSTKA
ncbi:FHA domain-containing protein [Ottowia thiooxydans]|uniref:FHA domain-containing protein n=1 Tax=Ottowia thiooxydans TaxID=219182 RepID=UPI000563D311|nr:FHA domain-containing protein [Ottowia thiooxydans]